MEFLYAHYEGRARAPLYGLLELTYRCNYNCVHCYNRRFAGSEDELRTEEFKDIIDQISALGGLRLCFSGGEPLLREDFFEIYSHAKEQGFIISIYTNGSLLDDAAVSFFRKHPPFNIEITFNAVDSDTYESIVGVKGTFGKAAKAIKRVAGSGLPLTIKANCLRRNKGQIRKIKAFAEKVSGGRNNCFKYDPLVLAGAALRAPEGIRLTAEEIMEVKKSNPEIWQEAARQMCNDGFLERERKFLFQCDSWHTDFVVSPSGRLKFCPFLDKHGVDLRKASFRQGFYDVLPLVTERQFTSDSKCRDCSLRADCYFCPGRSFIETGSEEGPVDYFCELARGRRREEARIRSDYEDREFSCLFSEDKRKGRT